MLRAFILSVWLLAALFGVCSAGAAEPPRFSEMDQEAANSVVMDLREKVVKDDQMMRLVQELQNDPEIQAILNDPSAMQAILSMDLNTLDNDPRIRKLRENPRMKKILQLLSRSSGR